jgi:hypothetical protein
MLHTIIATLATQHQAVHLPIPPQVDGIGRSMLTSFSKNAIITLNLGLTEIRKPSANYVAYLTAQIAGGFLFFPEDLL